MTDTEIALLRALAEHPARFVHAVDMHGHVARLVSRFPTDVDEQALLALRRDGLVAMEAMPEEGSTVVTVYRATALGLHRAGVRPPRIEPRNRPVLRTCRACDEPLDAPDDHWSVDDGTGMCLACAEAADGAWQRAKSESRRRGGRKSAAMRFEQRQAAERQAVGPRPAIVRKTGERERLGLSAPSPRPRRKPSVNRPGRTGAALTTR